jgi:predicted patatin/cPLA2 family phospholipase
MFTCGVLDVFMENGVEFDAASGISAGAVFGCNLKSRQPGRALRYNKTYGRDPRYCSVRSLITTGDLYGADFCYRVLPDELDVFDRETFRENPMPFYIGATDVMTGKIVYHTCRDGGDEDMQWMRASASMPMVSNVVEVGGYKLLDGGIVDAVPYHILEKKGYDKNVIILTQPENYVKGEFELLPLAKVLLRKYPAVVKALAVRHLRYNREMEEIRERELSGRALVIRPRESLGIKRTENDPEKLEEVYQTGRREGEKRLEEVQAFLADRVG